MVAVNGKLALVSTKHKGAGTPAPFFAHDTSEGEINSQAYVAQQLILSRLAIP
jgi:hypothetical protein